jgi:hypothetical protein
VDNKNAANWSGVMPRKPSALPLDQKPDHLTAKLDELRASMRTRSPAGIARRTGAVYTPKDQECGEFSLSVWEQELAVTYPEFSIRINSTAQECGIAVQALVLYYFLSANGLPSTGQYIAYSELPDGRFYSQAYNGYTGQELAKRFGDQSELLISAASKLGGIPHSLGDFSFKFHLFPNVDLLLVYWRGDEDFPTSCQILFDAAAAFQLPTDACAIAGSMLTRKLLNSI